ncbi:efflux RND transporter periplasmic adaptor subunit [Fusibacter ferrireducens]|uniref:HlyD family efflux transporter periplasmic adaptor subunit n=1 Tax=Fusibacter ferrireducens TaxID=2785058 RepID=A0ABR9ZW40_9FIRM|nr:HlyD family efflux transporter periplasmic adaptor subunit [Fusibacter ferrireducens]MBF4694667.1 HlyD family efflux transporter periplasmic adaptor subunit [Fusibacter ferrireducens]
MKKIVLLLIPIIVVGSFLLFKNSSSGSNEAHSEIQTTSVKEQDIQDIIYVSGKITTEAIRNVKPLGEEILERVLVKVGDQVHEGDVIAEMKTEVLEDQLKSKTIQLEIEQVKLKQIENSSDLALVNTAKTAKQAMEAANRKLDEDKTLLDSGIISKKQFEESQTAYDNAKLAYENALYSVNNSSRKETLLIQQKTVESLLNELATIRRRIEDSKIKAPIDGVITEIIATEGEAVKTNIMVISDFEKNLISANISEADFQKVKLGQKATITANSAKGKQYRGTVSFISPGSKTIEGKKQAYVEIKIKLDQPAPELRTNFSVNVQVVTAEKKAIKAVGIEAVNQRLNGEEYVYVKQSDGTTKEVTVSTGISNDVLIEIISDEVNVGDEIEIKLSNSVSEDNGDTSITGMY